MEKKTVLKIILISIIVVILIIVGIFWYNSSRQREGPIEIVYDIPELDSDIYRIETDMRWFTMMNDGGSHTNECYYIDFGENTVVRILEGYTANLGGTPESSTRVSFKKQMDADIQAEIKIMLDKVLEKEDINETENYHPFTISTLDYEKIIYNEDTIKEIKRVLRKIDAM